MVTVFYLSFVTASISFTVTETKLFKPLREWLNKNKADNGKGGNFPGSDLPALFLGRTEYYFYYILSKKVDEKTIQQTLHHDRPDPCGRLGRIRMGRGITPGRGRFNPQA